MPAKRQQQEAEATKTPPVFKTNSGSVHAVVWANVHAVEGEDRTFHSITMERNYPDDNQPSGFNKTGQLRQKDVGDAIACLQSVQRFFMKVETT